MEGPQRTSTSLYVGDLPIDLQSPEDTLFGMFNKVGMVMSIKVCRDINTQRSLGYAYVNFQSQADAERALKELNLAEIPGRPNKYVRVMWSARDPNVRKVGNSNIFIKNLDKAVDNRRLRDLFVEFGEITSCKVAVDTAGVSLGYGFVNFEKDESAKEAVAKMDGVKVDEHEIQVANFVRRAEREKEAEKTFTNIYVKNIKTAAPDDKVKSIIADAAGAPVIEFFMTSHPQHKTKFALANFASHESALKVINKLNSQDHELLTEGEEKLYVGRAMKKSDRQVQRVGTNANLYQSQGRNIYIKHLDDAITKDKLEELFSQFGKITSSSLTYDATKNFRGFGFVCFETKESATAAIREMNGKQIFRRPLYVSVAQQKDMRHNVLEEQRRTMMMNQQRMMMGGLNPMFGMVPPSFRQSFMPPIGFPGRGGPMLNRPPGAMPMPVMRGGMNRMPKMPVLPPRGPQYTQPTAPQVRVNTTASVPNPSQLANMSPEEQKNALGERLYTKIQAINYQQAAKITGMLLEMETNEILNVLEDRNLLQSKVAEAVSVLRQHDGTNQ